MKIEHAALWVADLELMKEFYQTYFNATANDRYHNPETGFSSYFLSFDSGARLELCHKDNLPALQTERLGYGHLALSVGSKADVDSLTQRLVTAGFRLHSGPRTTGDGYYESLMSDPEGNLIELTTD
ncbi:VOC family protein [Enterococcus asini]|uniref:VOC family protein n=1 Tax=Enterococcus asini TaxID=57732 RepID=UPI00288E9111|nr:VOC family protein [Enterococcus asini]MDT2756149.1 VOC family protein [Enterococcus asini]